MDLESFVHGSGKWFCTSLYSRPPANGFRVFCSWHWKWCKCWHIPIVDRSAPRAVSCCHKLNEIGASSSRTKGKYWNSLKILNNLFESERVLPSIHEVPKFSTCILQLHLNSTVSLQMIDKSLATVTLDWRRLELVLQFSARFFPKKLYKFIKKSI